MFARVVSKIFGNFDGIDYSGTSGPSHCQISEIAGYVYSTLYHDCKSRPIRSLHIKCLNHLTTSYQVSKLPLRSTNLDTSYHDMATSF